MRDRVARATVLGLGMGALFLFAACQHFRPPAGCGPDGCPDGDDCRAHAKVCQDPTVHNLACDLDHLEKHIDCYGSVVAKVPDVWGQARLTQYREDFENQMKDDLTKFDPTLSGSLSRTDQAFFQFSAALSSAASGTQPPPSVVTFSSVASTPAGPPAGSAGGGDAGSAGGTAAASPAATSSPPAAAASSARAATPSAKPAATPAAAAGAAAAALPPDPTATVQQASLTTFGFNGATGVNIGLEPTEKLAQKRRYLDYLNQLRRTNEGADTADAPGYSLNLMRVPVSVLPGKHTDVGYGAEITFSLEPVLGEDLLPMTFRNMVINDVTKSFGFPLTKFLDEERQRDCKDRLLTPDMQAAAREIEAIDLLARVNPGLSLPESGTLTAQLQLLDRVVNPGCPGAGGSAKAAGGKPQATRGPNQSSQARGAELHQAATRALGVRFTVPHVSFANGVQDREAFPPSQCLDVYGPNFAFEIAFATQNALRTDIARNGYVHLPGGPVVPQGGASGGLRVPRPAGRRLRLAGVLHPGPGGPDPVPAVGRGVPPAAAVPRHRPGPDRVDGTLQT